jgi:hypothetical protein
MAHVHCIAFKRNLAIFQGESWKLCRFRSAELCAELAWLDHDLGIGHDCRLNWAGVTLADQGVCFRPTKFTQKGSFSN